MENKYNITDAELEIMKELWENKQLSLNELTEELNKKEPRNKNTIKTLLYRLIEKGAVKSINKNQKENKFKANISKEKYLKKENQSFLNKLYNGNTSNMLLNFVENKEISKEELKKLIEMIED
jgi:BlaI family penicillinase repressor